MNKYLAALKARNLEQPTTSELPKVPKGAYGSFGSTQVVGSQKYSAADDALPAGNRPPRRPATVAEAAELRVLYGKLAAKWQWPMPETWKEDEPTMLADIDNALVCLRNLVREQCDEAV